MFIKIFTYPIKFLTLYGYLGLFIWSILEGEIGLMLAGWLASEKIVFTYKKIIIIAMIGALIGDTVTFTIGRFFKKFAISWLNAHPDKKELVEKLIKKYGAFVIIFERFIYGTHIPVMLSFGMMGYSYIKFFVYELIGTFLWALTFTSIGYYFGDKAIEIILLIQKNLVAILFLIIITFVLKKRKKS